MLWGENKVPAGARRCSSRGGHQAGGAGAQLLAAWDGGQGANTPSIVAVQGPRGDGEGSPFPIAWL